MQGNSDTLIPSPLCNILVQKYASRIYCQGEQVLTISQTDFFGFVL